MNTTIQYMHRTGDNCKTFAQVTVRGEITEEQVFELCTGPHPGWFNPVDLNLEYPDGASAVNLDENPWCEFLIPFHSPSGQKPTRSSADLLAQLEETWWNQDDKVTACPICGAEIQSTTEVWRSGVTLSADCTSIKSPGVQVDEDHPRVYCANDHTDAEMARYVSGDNTGRGVEIPTWTEA